MRRSGVFGYDTFVKLLAAFVIAPLALVAARVAREAAVDARPTEISDEPYAPSPTAAPFVVLGYREAGADLLWLRLTGYFGGEEDTANGIASLVEAINALDPSFRRVYEWGARAMTLAKEGVDQAIFQRAIAVLEHGQREFPTEWRLPYLEGQIYTQDLETKDPKQRAAWDERGTLLVESAMRKPNAPADAADWAAAMRTKLGEHQRAVDGLREMLLITSDDGARKRIIDKLAALEQRDASELAAELLAVWKRIDHEWQAARPAIPFTMYVLLGAPRSPRFDLTDLATGGRDFVGSKAAERLPPVE